MTGRGCSGVGGNVDGSGLAANRQRGFGQRRNLVNRFEAPSMNEIRARQEAVVANFLTFFQRKNTLVVELYRHCFYKSKPNKERIAKFIYQDLCPLPHLRQSIEDVQFHPVKMLLFVKCSDDQIRDELVTRLQSPQGVVWMDYKVRVKGYSLDPGVKFIRLLGAGPQTSAEEIKRTFVQAGIGEVVQIKKGLLDPVNLPGCTDGDWDLRVRITDLGKPIPSYVYKRDEGEIWSLNFEGRKFACWKCGSPSHIGDKCVNQARTFEEVFNPGDETVEKPTWAAIVKSGKPVTEEHRLAVETYERQIREDNQRRDKLKKDLEEKERLEEAEAEMRRGALLREKVDMLEKAAATAKNVVSTDVNFRDSVDRDLDGVMGDTVDMDDPVTNSELLGAVEKGVLEDPGTNSELLEAAQKTVDFDRRTRAIVEQHLQWLKAKNSIFSLTELGAFFMRRYAAVPSVLAIEWMGDEDLGLNEDGSMVWNESDIENTGFLTSTPLHQRGSVRRKIVSDNNNCENDVSSDDFENVTSFPLNVSRCDTREFNSSYVDSSSQSVIVQASKKQKLVDEVVVTSVGRVPGLGAVPEGLGASECSSVEPGGGGIREGLEAGGGASPLDNGDQDGGDTRVLDDGDFENVNNKKRKGRGSGRGSPLGLEILNDYNVADTNYYDVLAVDVTDPDRIHTMADGVQPLRGDGDEVVVSVDNVVTGGKEGSEPSDVSMQMESISPGSPEGC